MGFKKATKASIEFNSSFQIAESFYNLFNDTEKRLLNLASIEAAIFLQLHDKNIRKMKTIVLQEDFVGIKGDVCDIILKVPENHIGISAKHNHSAIKHPHLFGKIDFGKEWAGYPV
ncbi:HaeIII family restriction endonuclease [Bartonella grahamii]|uniref:HaeIII restriction endonuclease n=1 Tax=Bartonella grahamii TaxID=33045 RepID=A0A336NG26_BARGR|nr:HaeIII family restriction endonuclease [Bartonella grahamii]SSZ39641.1 HaeIII restriction endonuclease [Bartonella grahamii]